MTSHRLFKTLFITSLFGLFALCLIIFLGYRSLQAPLDITNSQNFVINKGASIKQITRQLSDQGIIENRTFFEWPARILSQKKSLKAGEYKINQDASILSLIHLFQTGKTVQRQVTIPEGLTVRQIAAILEDTEGLTGEINVDTLSEGYLMPQTYNFSKNDTRQSIIHRMTSAKSTLLNDLWDSYQKNDTGFQLPLKSKEEALILASIVEKETGVGAERAKVAGVFINRLNIGMMLQSDPTIIYPLSEKWGQMDRPLYRSDWKFNSSYNTYQVAGLPPTPICNPGAASLRAVFNPATHNYIYFVADGTGGHAFAKTLKDHNRNVTKWRKFKKDNNIEQ